jgi:hypothetical protein
LIREEHKKTSEIKKSKKAEDTRRLILHRLPLFLHEHTHSQTRVSYKWLSTDDNFVVRTFGKISVTKSLSFGDTRLSRSEDTSAVGKRVGHGPIQLWLAENCQVELYEQVMPANLHYILSESLQGGNGALSVHFRLPKVERQSFVNDDTFHRSTSS